MSSDKAPVKSEEELNALLRARAGSFAHVIGKKGKDLQADKVEMLGKALEDLKERLSSALGDETYIL
jgi:hypothetical protein